MDRQSELLADFSQQLASRWANEKSETNKLINRDGAFADEVRELILEMSRALNVELEEQISIVQKDRHIDLGSSSTILEFEFQQEKFVNRKFTPITINIAIGAKLISVHGMDRRIRSLDSVFLMLQACYMNILPQIA